MSESAQAPPTHALLELRLRGMLSTHCEVLRDGVEVTRTSTLYSPLHTRFEIAGRAWQTRLHVPGGRGIDLLREAVVGGLLMRGAFALQDDSGNTVASARERGPFTGGYTLDIGGAAGSLDTDRQRSRFDYRGPGGSGACQHFAAHRVVRASLPASLAVELQLFVTLLALRCWISFSSSNG